MDVHSINQFHNLHKPLGSLLRKTALAGVLATSFACVMNPAYADQLEAGLLAYDSGKFRLAETLLRPQAERGQIEAQVTLAKMLESGKDIGKNELEAKYWYRQAAENGDAEAQFCYSIMLAEEDELTDVTETESGYWLRQAADQDHPQAKLVYETMLNEDYQIGC